MTSEERTAQRDAARAKANEIRIERAKLKREVREGNSDLWMRLLAERHPLLEKLSLVEFMTWLPGVGEQVAARKIRQVFPFSSPYSAVKKIGELTDSEVSRLITQMHVWRGYEIPEKICA